MNSRVPVAAAIGVGYLLGRTHRLRWALILGGAAATGRMGGISTQVLERGAEMVRSTPELAKLADSASRLLDAGRGAAMSAMSSRAESITAGLEGQAGKISGGGTAAGKETGKKVAGGARRVVSGKEEGGEEEPSDESAEDEYEDEYDEEEADQDEGEEEEPEADEGEADEAEADEGEADEAEADAAEGGPQRRPVARRGRR
jgi:cobalamin biosynthesis protein CobT